MVRSIITPDKANILLSIPEEYIGKRVEITCFPLDEIHPLKGANKTMADFWSVLSDNTASKLHKHISESRNEWERDI